ncbi:gliding motility-associated peptidyl-prolyl isomerase GldI [Jejudonia soesokkakensis]|uniref:Peptidyl-prolyl cis-trans isomerase n=1 Tax=Jejudonia soesokkakensis TaxID=1323432 RepID=A0ABW2MVG4_9FLAO
MRSILFIIFVAFIFFVSCKSPEARRPVKQASGTFIEASAERNKKIFESEKSQIEALINADSTLNYKSSDSGFWYHYVTKDTLTSQKPVLGDKITFTYNVKKLDGTVILSEEENGLQQYKVDQSNQELISGIRDGIKLMKVGETITFLFPSYKAYGYYGIDNKLGTNVPIQSTVTLKSIEQPIEN